MLFHTRAHWKFLKTVVNKLFEFMHGKSNPVSVTLLERMFDEAKSMVLHGYIKHPSDGEKWS